HPEVDLDDDAGDRLDVDDAVEALEVALEPRPAIGLEVVAPRALDGPVVEGSLARRMTDGVAPPLGHAIDDGGVGAHMLALEQAHPHVARRLDVPVPLDRVDGPAAPTHALQVVDGLAEDRKALRHHAMRRRLDALGVADVEFVVDPAVARIELPAIPVI